MEYVAKSRDGEIATEKKAKRKGDVIKEETFSNSGTIQSYCHYYEMLIRTGFNAFPRSKYSSSKSTRDYSVGAIVGDDAELGLSPFRDSSSFLQSLPCQYQSPSSNISQLSNDVTFDFIVVCVFRRASASRKVSSSTLVPPEFVNYWNLLSK